jgi:hypothetical protein
MPAPPNIRLMVTGPNGANSSRMNSGSTGMTSAPTVAGIERQRNPEQHSLIAGHSRSKHGLASLAYDPAIHADSPL